MISGDMVILSCRFSETHRHRIPLFKERVHDRR
jgi:hypothetical protein